MRGVYFRASLTDQPSLSISAMNSKREPIEPGKELRGPALIQMQPGNKNVYWAVSWHMQTPLENLETGSFVLVEYRAKVGADIDSTSPSTVTATTQLPLEADGIDSGELIVRMGVPGDGGKANPILAAREGSTLKIDVMLSHKSLPVTLRMINKL